MTSNTDYQTSIGSPIPYGVSSQGSVFNFSITSRQASSLTLCLFNRNNGELLKKISLSPAKNKTGDVWHISVELPKSNIAYAYRIANKGHLNDDSANSLLIDPYAKSVMTSHIWGKNSLPLSHNQNNYRPYGDVIHLNSFDWEEDRPPNIPMEKLIIYEMHVRGFTQDISSEAKHPGTFLGVIEKIPHLLELGVNALELLPIQEFNEMEYRMIFPRAKQPLCNFWGYSTVNFFAPMNRYATSDLQGASIIEFKTMVKELHRNGIQVILDVVFNHTAEGDRNGPTLSFKGIDNAIYYMLDKEGEYLNFSGCGNTFNCNHPISQ